MRRTAAYGRGLDPSSIFATTAPPTDTSPPIARIVAEVRDQQTRAARPRRARDWIVIQDAPGQEFLGQPRQLRPAWLLSSH